VKTFKNYRSAEMAGKTPKKRKGRTRRFVSIFEPENEKLVKKKNYFENFFFSLKKGLFERVWQMFESDFECLGNPVICRPEDA